MDGDEGSHTKPCADRVMVWPKQHNVYSTYQRHTRNAVVHAVLKRLTFIILIHSATYYPVSIQSICKSTPLKFQSKKSEKSRATYGKGAVILVDLFSVFIPLRCGQARYIYIPNPLGTNPSEIYCLRSVSGRSFFR